MSNQTYKRNKGDSEHLTHKRQTWQKRGYSLYVPFRGRGIFGSGWQRQTWLFESVRGLSRLALWRERFAIEGLLAASVSRDAARFFIKRVSGGEGADSFSVLLDDLRESFLEEDGDIIVGDLGRSLI